jgi:hypothetical protein
MQEGPASPSWSDLLHLERHIAMTYASLDEHQRRFLNQLIYNVAIRWERKCEDRQKAFDLEHNLGEYQFFTEEDRHLLSKIFRQASRNPGYYLRNLYYDDPYNDFWISDCPFRGPDVTLEIAIGKLAHINNLLDAQMPFSSNDQYCSILEQKEQDLEQKRKQQLKKNVVAFLKWLGVGVLLVLANYQARAAGASFEASMRNGTV